jgi:uncharacterized BrkB/YihY/UPF0761 family membrane protein
MPKRKRNKKKSLLWYIPFLFVLAMVLFLVLDSQPSVQLSPGEDIDLNKALLFFALFIAISFTLSMVAIFILYYIVEKKALSTD